ncbi:MAG: ankyrin repeat domain-containing protein [Bacillota bacterium]|nr:ankyrin repeat domain-containing protein [Bacillota bacterium]
MNYLIILFFTLIIYGIYRFLKAWNKKVKEEQLKERKLIEQQINIRVYDYADKNGVTLLMKCLIYNFTGLANQLLEKNIEIDKKDHHGDTAIFYAIRRGQFDIFTQLISLGASLNHKNIYSETPLWYAAQKSDYRYLETLLNHKISLDIPDNRYSLTPILVAVKNQQIENISRLFKHGANLNHESREGSIIELLNRFIEAYFSGKSYNTYEGKELIREIRASYHNVPYHPQSYEAYKKDYKETQHPKEY